MKTNILTAVLLAAAIGVCSGYAQTLASSASIHLPGRSASDAPYEFRTDKSDGGINVSFTLNNVERVLVDSVTGKSRISVPGLSSTTFAGLPALPYKSFRIAPEGSGTPQIVVRDSTYIDCPINLDHNPEIRYDSIGQPQFIEVARIDYSGFMPSDLARVTDTQIYRDRPIYTITIMPMKYDRATGMLRIFTSLDIDIEYTVQAQTYANAPTRSTAFNAYTDRMLTEALGVDAVSLASDRPMVETQSIIGDTPGEKDPIAIPDLYDVTEDMLVISRGDFRAATDSLKEWKKNLGYRVHVVEDWNWTQAKVDSVIKRHYRFDRNLTTVLIMGIDRIVPLIRGRHCLTDLTYMCMDGSTDSNPDVAYGRALIYCTQHANEFVSKLIRYERGLYSDASVYNKAFLAGRYWWNDNKPASDRFIPTLEETYNILVGNNVNTQRIYVTDQDKNPRVWFPRYLNHFGGQDTVSMPAYLQKPQFQWNGTKQDIIKAFNSGTNLGIYNGHGRRDGWSGFTFLDSDCREFTYTNSAPLVFSIGCNTADHKAYHNCLVGELSRRNSGAIAVIASTYATYLGWSDALLTGMIDVIWPNTYTYEGWTDPIVKEPQYRLYDILNQGHNHLEVTQGGGYWDYGNIPNSYFTNYNRETFCVFGDPTLLYNTFVPTPYQTVACLSNKNEMSINIGSSELPAKVVVKNKRTGEISTRHITTFSLPNENKYSISGDTLDIVVSGHNKIPYQYTFIPSTSEQLPDGRIKSVEYDRATQVATVSYAISNGGVATFMVTDLNNVQQQIVVELGTQPNQQKIHLSSVPNGMCIITLLIDGKIEDTYKLLKQ